jgi:hypothetical protein
VNQDHPIGHPYTGPTASHDGSLAATVNLPWFPITAARLSMGLAWTGTPTGTFKLQHSFDGGTTPIDTPGAAVEFTAQPAGAAGAVAPNWSNLPGLVVRLVYTRTGGTGTLVSWQAQGPA